MSNNELIILQDFGRAIARLGEVLILEKNPIHRDSAIKRFELCFDLAWKSIKIYAKNEGIECSSPRECFKTGFQLGLIDYDEKWLAIIDDRNLTAHLYKEEHAEQVYSRLSAYLELFKNLLGKIKQKM